MSTEKNDEPLYNDRGQRLCGALRPNGKRCGRAPDRGEVRCFRHRVPRDADGKAPKRGKTWLDDRAGVDVSYIDKLGLGFDPQSADMQFELELTNKHIAALTKEYDAALRDVKAGRTGPNPRAIRAELTALFQTKTRLVKASTERLKITNSMLTFDQACVFYALLLYVVKRRGLSQEQWTEFIEELRMLSMAPWRIAELEPIKGGGMDEVKHLFQTLWEERHGTPPPGRTPPVEGDER